MAASTHQCILLVLTMALLLFLHLREASSCQEQDLKSLLSFKKELTDPSNRLSSWTGKDCCSWPGITCSNQTGRVVRLDLRNEAAGSKQPLEGSISTSLLGLHQLVHLDLSWNDFDDIPIPGFIGSFTRLQYLNLSSAGFGGSVPHQLGNLSSLRRLDLSDNLDLVLDHPRWLSELTSLQFLDLSYLSFPGKSNWLQALNMLPCLVEVHLSQCIFSHSIPLHLPHTNFSSLSTLDLSDNYFNSSLPGWLFNVTSLENLNLGGNYFQVVIPDAVKDMIVLKELDLSFSQYIGGFPETLSSLCQLRSLYLSWMNITGDLAMFEGILEGCSKNNMENLDLGGNQLEGHLPEWIGELKNLRSLLLYENRLSGPIPASLGRLSALETLNIAGNHLNGTIPQSLGEMASLTYLNLPDNFLEGTISESHLAKLNGLQYLDISSNLLSLKVSSDWLPPFQLQTIRVGSCKLGPQFPSWLRNQVNYSWLDLSNSGIADAMPNWFWNLSSTFIHLDLSHNYITGEVPSQLEVNPASDVSIDLSSNLFTGPLPLFSLCAGSLDLSNNSFSGLIPRSIGDIMPELSFLSLSKNRIQGTIPSSLCRMMKLNGLDLSRNQLSGELPNCWNNSSRLEILDVSNNNIIGEIPSTICSQASLKSLHLSSNLMYGNLADSMKNCTGLLTLDLGNNKFTGRIPTWIGGSLPSLKILSLKSNKFIGDIPHELSNLAYLQILDLSYNNLSGPIPARFGNFSAMKVSPKSKESIVTAENYKEKMLLVIKNRQDNYVNTLSLVTALDLSENSLSGIIPKELTTLYALLSLNLSGNHLTGGITYKFGLLQQLESLDLSRNQLSGTIPTSLSNLTFLSQLNVSYNNLSGKIPSIGQLSTFTDPSVYIGNQDLCGFPLPKECATGHEPADGGEGSDNNDNDQMIWFFIGVGSGFAAGFWSVWGILLFKKAWREAYFMMIDNMYDSLYVKVVLSFRSLKAKMLQRSA